MANGITPLKENKSAIVYLCAVPNGVLTWSQTKDGENWSLWKADYDNAQKKWINPAMIESEGNPRFGSCEYDSQGRLWLAYSEQNDTGRKVIVKQSN